MGHKEKLALAVLLSLIVGTFLFALEHGLKPDEVCLPCLRPPTPQSFDFL